MIQKQIDLTHLLNKERNLRPDLMNIFTLEDNQLRGAIVNTTIMANRISAYHESGILESLALAHAATGVILLTSDMKGNERVVIQTSCSGPLKGYSVEADARGKVRGFLKATGIVPEKPLENFDISPFMGIGFLTVTRYLEKSSKPFTGQVTMETGNVAGDLAHYLTTSQQIPSSLNISVKFNKEGKITGAGGLLIQALPGASRELLDKAATIVNNLPSLGETFAEDLTAEEYLFRHFAGLSPEVFTSRPVEFYCPCTKERYADYLGSLPHEELEDIINNGPLPAEIHCHNCNSRYMFEKEELQNILMKN